mmetsp:Transcript_32097/g.96177  ORF Transcript_32097/g.96177 Transcript_32097/m.96177 type:complete len:126 (+) Transcript_32097:767-1144(+)
MRARSFIRQSFTEMDMLTVEFMDCDTSELGNEMIAITVQFASLKVGGRMSFFSRVRILSANYSSVCRTMPLGVPALCGFPFWQQGEDNAESICYCYIFDRQSHRTFGLSKPVTGADDPVRDLGPW